MENSFDYITENYNRIYNEIEAAKAQLAAAQKKIEALEAEIKAEKANGCTGSRQSRHSLRYFPAGGKSGAGISFQAGLL